MTRRINAAYSGVWNLNNVIQTGQLLCTTRRLCVEQVVVAVLDPTSVNPPPPLPQRTHFEVITRVNARVVSI